MRPEPCSCRTPVLGLSFSIALLISVASQVGCGHGANVGSVSGTVRLDGKPLESGTVRFVPDAGRAATGKINLDGTYTLGTFAERDGAVVGKHKVAIVAYAAGGDGRPAYEVRSQTSKLLVPERYLAPGTSGLTFEVKPGGNQADFDLMSK